MWGFPFGRTRSARTSILYRGATFPHAKHGWGRRRLHSPQRSSAVGAHRVRPSSNPTRPNPLSEHPLRCKRSGATSSHPKHGWGRRRRHSPQRSSAVGAHCVRPSSNPIRPNPLSEHPLRLRTPFNTDCMAQITPGVRFHLPHSKKHEWGRRRHPGSGVNPSFVHSFPIR